MTSPKADSIIKRLAAREAHYLAEYRNSEEARDEPSPSEQGTDKLLVWAARCMARAKNPKSARDVVDDWFSYWYGRKGRPEYVAKGRKTDHVDGVAKWMQRQLVQGTMELVDYEGYWGSKRYRLADCARYNPVKQKLVKTKRSAKIADTISK